MANLPFSIPQGLPIPRRFILLGLSATILVLIIHLLTPSGLVVPLRTNSDDEGYFGSSKWLPPLFNSADVYDRPPEFDEDGQCLFVSAYDALSPQEKRRAELMEFEEVSAGVVKAKYKEGVVVDEMDMDLDEMESSRNGTLLDTSGLSHPILGLLRQGEIKWNDKLASQSRNVEQAAEVYMDKWGRPPPKGFELWWRFTQTHKILMPDEYDSIMKSFLPFYGLPVSTLQERLKETEKIPETFTLVVHDGKVELQWNDDYARDTWIASRGRADKQINLMEPFIGMLGSFRATYTIHDQPTILLDYERHQQLVEAAKKGTVSTIPNDADRHEANWHGACGPNDPINKAGYEEQPETDTFILSHAQAMDICQHPSYLDNHGMLLEVKDSEAHPQPHTKLYPILVPSKTMLNADIPITPVGNDNGIDQVGNDPEWSKKINKMYWRGLATGLNHNKKTGAKWRQSHRERLHFLANDKKHLYQEILSPIGNTGEAELARYQLSDLGEYYMDVRLAGGHWQCDWDDGTCQEMNDEINFAGTDRSDRSNDFKYVFDTDGNAWSSRFPRLMAASNMVIKASVFPEWNTQTLPEWFAYVPSKMDYSDLYSILAFFRGTPNGKGGHDEVARRIAVNSQCWVEKTWRKEDMQAYMFLLYLEYARLTSPDRDTGKMDFAMPGKHHTGSTASHPDHAAKPATQHTPAAAAADSHNTHDTPMIQEVDPGAPPKKEDMLDAAAQAGVGTDEGPVPPDNMREEYIE